MITLTTALPAQAQFDRQDFRVASGQGLEIAVRLVRRPSASTKRGPILLVHGARVGSVASFDVDVPGFSLAEDLARAGHAVYLADVRGYGASSFPADMRKDRFAVPPAVPTAEAVTDLKHVRDMVAGRHPGDPISALGWATGSHWLAATEATHPGSIDRLVFFNSVYGGQGDWRLTGNFAVDGRPSEFNHAKFGGYRLSTAKSLVGRWTQSEAISEAFIKRYVELAMAGDPTAQDRNPASFRHPSGPIADTLRAVHIGPLYDASKIRSHVLIVRSGNDFWSRPVDVSTMQRDLTKAASVVFHELEGASHYVHLEPGEQRQEFLDVVLRFAAGDGA